MTTDSLLTNNVVAKDTIKQIITSVEHHYNDSSIIEIIAVVIPFVFVLTFMALFFHYKFKKEKLIAQERMKMIENGIPLPSNEREKLPKNSSFKVSIFISKLLFGFGAGLFLGLVLNTILPSSYGPAAYFSMIFISIGFVMIFGDMIIDRFLEKNRKSISENNLEKK